MARLVFRIGNVPKVLNLGAETITIGRRPDNQIAIDDGFASAVHCTVSAIAGGYLLEDLKSSNGTLLNGERVANARLKHGDIITIGRMQIGYFDEQPAAAPDMSATVRMPAYRPGPPPEKTAPRAPAEPSAAEATYRPFSVKPAPAARPVPATPPAAAGSATIPKAAPPPPPEPVLTQDDLALTPVGSTLPPPVSRTPAWASNTPTGESPRFIIPDEKPPTSGVGSQGQMAPSDVNMLDQLVGSIRSHRDREHKEREEQKEKLRGEWERALVYAEHLRGKISSDPRIKYFGINRRANDVMIRFQRSPSLPMQYMMLSLEHPENKNNQLIGIWFRRSGENDRLFQTADELAAEMIREFAFLLA